MFSYSPRTRKWSLAALLALCSGLGAFADAFEGSTPEECVGEAVVELSAPACASTLAVGLYGDAQGHDGDGLAHCIAISIFGDARNDSGPYTCGFPDAQTHIGIGCIAIAGAGDASNAAGSACADAFLSAAVGCIALSGLGDAENDVGG